MRIKTVVFSVFLSAFASAVSADDAVICSIPGDWNDNPKLKEHADGSLELLPGGRLSSTRIFRIDPAKKYRLSGVFKAGKGKPKLNFSLRIYDRDRAEIQHWMVNPVDGTETELVEACKQDDKTVRVKGGVNLRRGSLVGGAKSDYSDLPNGNLIGIIRKSEPADDGSCIITLNGGVRRDYPAGTRVRAHYGYLAQNTGGMHVLTPEWKTLGGSVSGMAKKGYGGKEWRPGAAYAQILITAEGKDVSLFLKNVRFEEEK